MLITNDGYSDVETTYLGFQKCTDADWEKFYDPSRKSETLFNHMKENNYMNCLTGLDKEGNKVDMEIYGPDEISPHKRLELFYRPCIPVPFQVGIDPKE